MTEKKPSKSDFDLLKTMCAIHAPSGNERPMTDFVLAYVEREKHKWKVQPKVYAGEKWQDCIMLVFGKPRTAVFAHLDSIGFTVRYNKQLVKIGGPQAEEGFELVTADGREARLAVEKDKASGQALLRYRSAAKLRRGDQLTFKAHWRETRDYVQCCYMDNRLGVWCALRLAETLENGAIAFSCYEEHGGGTVAYLQRFLHRKYKIRQALIADITWVTEGVHAGKGAAISLRDSLIPRKAYLDRIISIARKHKLSFQLEVEGAGGSDAKELQMAENLWDWCFIGAAEAHVHTPYEKVHKKDIVSMLLLYETLLREL